MRIGYKLATEGLGPKELIRQAVLAEQAGFDFVEMSDHYHPWVEAQGHSAFTWSLLSAIAVKTERIGLVTGVTCPSMRYHPAMVAQAAATLAIISDGRFTLGVGAGERLNEHVTGEGFPARRERHERLREALEIIRLLWQGGYRSYDGKYLKLEDARVFDLPEQLPVIAVAASGPQSARIAADLGGGLFAVEPDGDLIDTWHGLAGRGPAYGEVDPMPMMEMFDRGIQLRMGQAHVKRWIDDLMPVVTASGDPLGVRTFATHHLPLEEAPHGYQIFRDKAEGCIKVVLQP